MKTLPILKCRLAALRLNHLPPVVRAWIKRDLAGMDAASIEATLTPKYAALATRRAIEEMARVGVPAVRDNRRRPRKYLADQMEFGFVASLKRPAAARPPEGR